MVFVHTMKLTCLQVYTVTLISVVLTIFCSMASFFSNDVKYLSSCSASACFHERRRRTFKVMRHSQFNQIIYKTILFMSCPKIGCLIIEI